MASRDSLGRALGRYSAEIVRQNLSAERDLHLLARIEVRPDEILEWYELGPGLVMVSGAGMPATDEAYPEPEKGRDDPASIWADATGDAPIPKALRAALARAPERSTESKQQRPVDPLAPTPDPHVPPPEPTIEGTAFHLNLGWCDKQYYTELIPAYGPSGYAALGDCPSNSKWNYRKCWEHVTGFYAASNDDCLDHRSNVCPFRGNIRMTIEADEGWITTGSYQVPEQSYRWKTFRDNYCENDIFNDCPYVRVKVDQADGDGYQYKFMCDDTENI